MILDQWDRFNHAAAWEKLQAGLEQGEPHSKWLEESRLSERLEKLAASERNPAPELVEDLWLNAHRKADLGLFDDAIARLYRLMEVAVQTRLYVAHGILTDNVPPESLPESMREFANSLKRNDQVRLVLAKSIELLKHLDGSDPLVDLLKSEPNRRPPRNRSVLAHGFTPLGKYEWRNARNWFDRELKHVWEEMLGRPTACRLPGRLPNVV